MYVWTPIIPKNPLWCFTKTRQAFFFAVRKPSGKSIGVQASATFDTKSMSVCKNMTERFAHRHLGAPNQDKIRSCHSDHFSTGVVCTTHIKVPRRIRRASSRRGRRRSANDQSDTNSDFFPGALVGSNRREYQLPHILEYVLGW